MKIPVRLTPKFKINISQSSRHFQTVTIPRKSQYPELTQSRFTIECDKKELTKRVQWVLSQTVQFSTSLNIRFCDAEEMASSNGYFRNKHYATDVLSFPNSPQQIDSLGDLLICLPVCLLQAKKHKVTMSSEVEKMIIHGIIHLKGFDHERNDAAHKIMSTLERIINRQLCDELGPANWIVARSKV